MSYHRFSIIQGRAVVDQRVSNAQLRTLAALGQYADKDGWCWPSQSTLGEDLGKSRQTVNEDIGNLVDYGYIEKWAIPTGRGKEVQVRYRLIFDFPKGDVEVGGQGMSSLPDSNDPLNDPSNVNTETVVSYTVASTFDGKVNVPLSLENQIFVGQPITSLPKDNDMLKVAEVIAKSFKTDHQLAIDILMAFQKTRGITFLYEDQKKHKKALTTLIKSGVKPEHVVTAVKELMKVKYTVTDLFSIQKTAINLANPAPSDGKKKLTSGYTSPKPGL